MRIPVLYEMEGEGKKAEAVYTFPFCSLKCRFMRQYANIHVHKGVQKRLVRGEGDTRDFPHETVCETCGGPL